MPVPDYRSAASTSDWPAGSGHDRGHEALQYDVVSLQARELLEIFLPDLPEGEIKRRLRLGLAATTPSSVEATWFSRLYRNVLLQLQLRIRGSPPRR